LPRTVSQRLGRVRLPDELRAGSVRIPGASAARACVLEQRSRILELGVITPTEVEDPIQESMRWFRHPRPSGSLAAGTYEKRPMWMCWILRSSFQISQPSNHCLVRWRQETTGLPARRSIARNASSRSSRSATLTPPQSAENWGTSARRARELDAGEWRHGDL
jgi:hypothetical protein